MISDDKMSHVIHLMLDGLEKAGLARFPRKEEALREAKKVGNKYLVSLTEAEAAARLRITSQKNPPPEFSPQFQTLYQKYYEEEIRKRGGGIVE
jgi:uncharacterized protein